MEVKRIRAEEAIQKHQAYKAKIEKEIQAQKIAKALQDNGQTFNADQERERIRAELFEQLQTQANQFVANREKEM